MSRIPIGLLIPLSGLLFSGLLVAQEQLVLRDGTPIRVRLNRDLSTASATVGESADCEVVEEVKVGDTVLIARGAAASATVLAVQAKRKLIHAGKIELSFDSVRLVNEDKIALRAAKTAPGSGGPTTIIGGPAMAKGTEFTAYIAGDVMLDPAKLTAKSGPETVPVHPMTNEDIVAMKAAGISDELVIIKIRFGTGAYNIAPDAIIALKQAKVSEAVIEAMMEVAAPAAPPPPQPAEGATGANDTPHKGILGKLKVAILGSPDAWSNKAPAHQAPTPGAADPPAPPQLSLCPVTILSQPADAVILVDGYPAGRTPAVVKLQPGTYKVTLQAPGFPSYTQQIVVEAGQVRSFGVALETAK